MTTRRETLKGMVLLAAADKLTDGGLEGVSLPGVPDRTPVLPPGAGVDSAFARKCVACQLCISACPENVLKPSTRLSRLGQPEMDFRYGFCRLACTACSRACPAGALRVLQPEQRPHVHMGQAVWRKDLCVRTTSGDACTACVRKCPVQAVRIVDRFPVVNRDLCIGCGACEHVCPARPMPAISVEGFKEQRIVTPVTQKQTK